MKHKFRFGRTYQKLRLQGYVSHLAEPNNIALHCCKESDVKPKHTDKSKEKLVVAFADAVIKPITMVIEFIATPVTLATMLCFFSHKALTN